MTTRVNSDTLDEIYKKWLNHRYPADVAHQKFRYNHIDRVNLTYSHGKEFDLFVWECGGHIRKENRKRYIHFFNDEDATMFLLRWT